MMDRDLYERTQMEEELAELREAVSKHADEAGVWQKDAEDWKVRCVKAEREAETLRKNLREVYELSLIAHDVS